MKNRPILTAEEDELRDGFFEAITDKDIEAIIPLLEVFRQYQKFHGVDDYAGNDFMHEVGQNMEEIVEVDIANPELGLWKKIQTIATEHKLSVDTLNNDKETALSLLHKDLEYKEETRPYFEFLWSQSKDLDTTFDNYQYTLLYNAFEKRNLPVAQRLLEKGANPFQPIQGYQNEFVCTKFLSEYSGNEEQSALLLNILQHPGLTSEFLLHLVEQAFNNAELQQDLDAIASTHPEIFSAALQVDNSDDSKLMERLQETLEEAIINDMPLLCDMFIQHDIPPGKDLLWYLSQKKKQDENHPKVTTYYDKVFTLAAQTGTLTPELAYEFDEYGYLALMAEQGNGPDVAYHDIGSEKTTLLHGVLNEIWMHKDSNAEYKNIFFDIIKAVPNINWNQENEEGNRLCDLVLASGDKELIEAAGVFELVFGKDSESRFRYHTQEELDIFQFEDTENKTIKKLLSKKDPSQGDSKTMQGLINIAAQCGNADFLKEAEKNEAYAPLLEGNDRARRLINSDIPDLIETVAINMSHNLQNDPKQSLELSNDEMQLTLAAWKEKKDLKNTYFIGRLAEFKQYLEKQNAQPSSEPEIIALENKGHAMTFVFYPNKEKPDQPTMFLIDSFGHGGEGGHSTFSKDVISLAARTFPNAKLKEAYDARQTSDMTCRIRTLNDVRYIAKNLTVEKLEEHINDPKHVEQTREIDNGSTIESISLPLGLMRDSYNLYLNKDSGPSLTHRMQEDLQTPLNKRQETIQVFLSRVLDKGTGRNHYLDIKLEHMQRDVVEFMLDVEDEVSKAKPGKEGEHAHKIAKENKERKVEEALEKYKDDISLKGQSRVAKLQESNKSPPLGMG